MGELPDMLGVPDIPRRGSFPSHTSSLGSPTWFLNFLETSTFFCPLEEFSVKCLACCTQKWGSRENLPHPKQTFNQSPCLLTHFQLPPPIPWALSPDPSGSRGIVPYHTYTPSFWVSPGCSLSSPVFLQHASRSHPPSRNSRNLSSGWKNPLHDDISLCRIIFFF